MIRHNAKLINLIVNGFLHQLHQLNQLMMLAMENSQVMNSHAPYTLRIVYVQIVNYASGELLLLLLQYLIHV